MPKNPLSFPGCASAERKHSQQPVELPQLIFSDVFLFQGDGQISALPSISITLSADT